MKKIALSISFAIAISLLASCSGGKKINFYNYDGTLLWQTSYKSDGTIEYGGETPTKPTDEMYDYTFSGWNHSLYEADTYKDYYAQFEKSLRNFKVTFRDYDNTFISDLLVPYGSNVARQAPNDMTRADTQRTHYHFSGWSGGDLTYVTSDLMMTAEYSEIECFQVTYVDNDGSIIKTEYIEKGGSSSFVIDSYRDAGFNQVYVFDSWSESVVNVQCDMMVIAQYKLANAYTVTFKNYDGSILGTDKGPEGFTAKYKGSTPYRASYTSGGYRYSYTFTGWDKDLTNVRNSFETTALFKTTAVNYKYSDTVEAIKNYVIEHGGYSDGMYGYVFNLETSSGYLYTSIAQTAGYNGRLDLWITSTKSDSTGTRGNSVHVYLDDSWNNGYFDFSYQFLIRNSSNVTVQEDLGNGSFYGPTFTSNTKLYFDYYRGETNESVASYQCALLISILLDRFSKSSSWSMSDLGFNNY